jgi:alpha-tubulin suppressor-like RCC1 family protein
MKYIFIALISLMTVVTYAQLPEMDDNQNFSIAENSTVGTVVGELSHAANKLVSASYSAGARHSLVILQDGTLWAWGKNDQGQLGDGTNTDRLKPVQVGTETIWESVSASPGPLSTGNGFTVAIKTNGTLWAWGNNSAGVLADGTNNDSNIPKQIGTDTDWKEVVSGYNHVLAIKDNGELYAWGDNSFGQLGSGNTTALTTPTKIGSASWTMVDAGETHSLGIQTDGTLWSWGSGQNGRLGNGSSTGNVTSPTKVGTATDWAQVSAGRLHSLARKTGNTLWAWGDNSQGQLGDGSTTESNVPKQIGTDTDWSKVSAGYTHSMAIKTNNRLYAWGQNDGRHGNSSNANTQAPAQVGTSSDWADIDATHVFSLARKTSNKLYIWGTSTAGDYSGLGGTGIFNYPANINKLGGMTFTIQSGNDNNAFEVDNTGNIKVKTAVLDVETKKFYRMRVGGNNGNAVVQRWFNVYLTNVNDNAPVIHDTPIRVVENSNDSSRIAIPFSDLDNAFEQVQNGQYGFPGTDIYAIMRDGRQYRWGSTNGSASGRVPQRFGTDKLWKTYNVRLEDGTIDDNSAQNLINYRKYSETDRIINIALREDSTLWRYDSPNWNQVLAGTKFIDATIFSQGDKIFGLKANGEVYYPSQNFGFTKTFKSMHEVYSRQLADAFPALIATDGTLWYYNRNTSDGAIGYKQQGADTNWKYVSSYDSYNTSTSNNSNARRYFLSVKTDGTLWAWGDNDRGQIGDGTKTIRSTSGSKTVDNDRPNPIQVGKAKNWQSTYANLTSMAIRTDGSLWVWGGAYADYFTDNPGTEDLIVPTQVPVIGSYSYELVGGQHASLWAIDTARNVMFLKGNNKLDYETHKTMEVVMKITEGTFSTTDTVKIELLNINDNAPSVSNLDPAVREDVAVGTVVWTPQVSDVDGDTTFTWSYVVGSSSTKFNLDTNTGVITVKELLDRESSTYSRDTTMYIDLSDGTNTRRIVLGIDIQNVNDNAPVINTSTWFVPTVRESAPRGELVGNKLEISDRDQDSVFTWSIVPSTYSAAFNINNGQISVADSSLLDYESFTSVSLGIIANDGVNNSDTATIRIQLENSFDEPPVITPGQSATVNEDVTSGTILTLMATDPDRSTNFGSWTIVSGNTDDAFTIQFGGLLQVIGQLDFETTPLYNLGVTVQDGEGFVSDTAIVIVNVNNVVEPSFIYPDQSATIEEHAAVGTEVLRVQAFFEPGVETLSNWQLISGNDDGSFAIDGNGTITVANSETISYEERQSILLGVSVDDNSTTVTDTITVNLTDINEKPRFNNESYDFVIPEDAENGFVIGNVEASDPDGTPITYSFATEQTIFNINAETGVITVSDNSSFTPELVIENQVRASDGILDSLVNIRFEIERVLGLDEGDMIKIYPNPASESINFKQDTQIAWKSIIIMDQTGRILRSFPVENRNMEIDISFLEPGVYYLRLQDLTRYKTLKLIKI